MPATLPSGASPGEAIGAGDARFSWGSGSDRVAEAVGLFGFGDAATLGAPRTSKQWVTVRGSSALALVSGCDQTISLPTHQFSGAGGVLFELTLRGANGCVWLEGDRGIRFGVLWPAGASAHADPLELIAPDGRVFARAGDLLALDASEHDDISIGACQVGRIVLIIGEVVSVNGAELHVPATPVPTSRQPVRRMR